MIMHGLFGSSSNWQSFGRKLAVAGYEVILPDLRNHGRSPHHRVHTYDAMSEDILELVQTAAAGRATLMGHSMGGKTAMLTALRHPEAVIALLVLDMAPRAYRPDNFGMATAMAALDIQHLPGRAAADQALAPAVPDVATRQFLLKNLVRKDGGGFSWQLNMDALLEGARHMSEAIDGRPFEREALFVKGERSSYITGRDTATVHRLFPRARIVTAPGAGHLVHVDAFDWLLETTVDFLGKGK